MSIADNPVYAKNVIEFVTVANEYCTFLEMSEKIDLKAFIEKAHKLLPLVYLKGALLPELDTKYEEFNQKFVNEQDYTYIHTKLLRKLGSYDSYEEVFNPLRHEGEETVAGSISENLTDIYQDIKDFVLLYEIGSQEVMYEAIWECKQAFETYWGQRLTNVLRALHFLCYSPDVIENEESVNSNNSTNLSDLDTNDWIISRKQEDYNDEE